MRALLFIALACASSYGESFQASDSFSIGPEGLSFQTPGARRPLQIKNDGNGVFSTSFSITGDPGKAAGAANGAPAVRVQPARPATPPASWTDSNTFFKSVGK